MELSFGKATCQNIRKSLKKEWLLTNGLGGYSSSTILCCNTRKYHGLLVSNLTEPVGRHVLLSNTEESICAGGKEFFLSTRDHPDVYYPRGYDYIDNVKVGRCVEFTYKIGDLYVKRDITMVQGKNILLMRYTYECQTKHPPFVLRIKPLLAYRNFHNLTFENTYLQSKTTSLDNGFKMQPYQGMPEFFMQIHGEFEFVENPVWYKNIEYLVEEKRGFPFAEDLFVPGSFDIALKEQQQVIVSVSTEEITENLAELWEEEHIKRRVLYPIAQNIYEHFVNEGKKFIVTDGNNGLSILAGYHWFDSWGRDSLIALPGLTFCAGRMKEGIELVETIGKTIHKGLVPNCFSIAGDNHAYNSVDASLWYVWAVQKLLQHLPDHANWVYEHVWSTIKDIIDNYKSGTIHDIYMDDQGLIHAGNVHTQLTWMDAQVNGGPVTPRHGYPVEINALWYNALAFTNELANKFNEPDYCCYDFLKQIRTNFHLRFWTDLDGGHLGDVWDNGVLDTSIRPNQIFAVSMPHAVLEEEYQPFVVENIRNNLLTAYGLRTLSPAHLKYKGAYEGDPQKRDAAYHQGTIWPWLMGHYADALMQTAWDIPGAAKALLDTVTPLVTTHLLDAGIGTVSEIFDGSSPHRPNGTIAQAWSVSECLRLLKLIQIAEPDVYAKWETTLVSMGGNN